MAIKIPFIYTEYKNSKIATEFDKMCHSSSKVAFGFISSLTIGMYAAYCLGSIPMASELRRVLGCTVGVICAIICISSFFLGIICDRFALSRKIAIWDITRKAAGRPLITKKAAIIAFAAVAVIALPGIAAYLCGGLA